MKTLIYSIAFGGLALTAMACEVGVKAANPCEAAQAAMTSCSEAFAAANDIEIEDPEGDDAPSACTQTSQNDAIYTCIADAYQEADCKTQEGLEAAGKAGEACVPDDPEAETQTATAELD